MRILFAGKQHFETGGIDRNTDQLARRLIARGHEVQAMAAPAAGHVRRNIGLERVDGFDYPAWAVVGASPAQGLTELLPRFRPEVVVVNSASEWFHDWTRALVTRCAGVVPCAIYIHGHDSVELLDEFHIRPEVVWACADTHASALRKAGHDPIVVSPLVEPDHYRVEPAGEVVLFVNPVKAKGVRTAVTLAAMRRDVPFVFLCSWNLNAAYLGELEALVGRFGNVEIAEPVPDPRPYYARARLLLAPYDDLSRPRVVTEAQLSGIPVLAYDDDGFREAVGPGGILVPRDAPMSEWLVALGRLWDDAAEHQRRSTAALAHSRRPEADPERIVATAEASLHEAVAKFKARRPTRTAAAPATATLVSVIIPVRNGAATIDDQLHALARQTYRGDWELIVSDNGCTDGTRGRVLSWEGGFPAPIRIVDASARRGVSHARNVGVAAANGDFILICDADDIVSNQWVERMAEALQDHHIVTGLGDRRMLNVPEQYEWMGNVDETGAPVGYGFLPYAAGGNLGVRRNVARALGGFDEALLRAEDIDWSWRALYAGYHLHFVPSAVVHYRSRSEPGALVRQRFLAGRAEALLYRRYRTHGMTPEPREHVIDVWRWLFDRAGDARRDPQVRYRWTATASMRAGRVVGSIRHRAWFL